MVEMLKLAIQKQARFTSKAETEKPHGVITVGLFAEMKCQGSRDARPRKRLDLDTFLAPKAIAKEGKARLFPPA